jgi:hypothetical protein
MRLREARLVAIEIPGIEPYAGTVNIQGDQTGIDALRALHASTPGFMRSLLEDVRSTTDNTTFFRDDQERRWKLALDPNTNALTITPAPKRTTQPPPAGD